MCLGLQIVGVHKALFLAFIVGTSRKRFEACIFLSTWVVKLDGAAQT